MQHDAAGFMDSFLPESWPNSTSNAKQYQVPVTVAFTNVLTRPQNAEQPVWLYNW
jgi:hypothetical protein